MNQFRAEEYLADTRVDPAPTQRGSTVESISAWSRLIAPLLAIVLCSPILAQSGRPDPTPPPPLSPSHPRKKHQKKHQKQIPKRHQQRFRRQLNPKRLRLRMRQSRRLRPTSRTKRSKSSSSKKLQRNWPQTQRRATRKLSGALKACVAIAAP
jgi:hypothetical protein